MNFEKARISRRKFVEGAATIGLGIALGPGGDTVGSMKSVESLSPKKEKLLRDRISFAAADKAVEFFRAFENDQERLDKYFKVPPTAENPNPLPPEPVNPETAREILYSFFEELIGNTNLYESKEQEAGFPWSVIDTGEIAKKLYARVTKKPLPRLSERGPEERTKHEKDFIFSNFSMPTSGGTPYIFFEQAMHRVLGELPAAFEDIQKGIEPHSHQIYTVGAPTSQTGVISEKFVGSLKDNHAYDEFGKMYAGFVRSVLPHDAAEAKQTALYFRGISMAGGFAVETAKHLVNEHAVTQDLNIEKSERPAPFLQVRIDTAPGQTPGAASTRKVRTFGGFFATGAWELGADILSGRNYLFTTILNEQKFVRQVFPVLAEKGINVHMEPGDIRLKKEAISNVLKNLYAGVPIPENLKVTEVRGQYDLLTFTPGFSSKLAEQREKARGSLGQNIVKTEEKNRRVHGADMMHNVPNFPESAFARMHRAAKGLEAVQKQR
ncbi:MAG: hypothetical protein AAB480_00500 [Patescibacteria group bacterium]